MSSIPSHAISKEELLFLRYYFYVRKYGEKVVVNIFKYNIRHGTTKTIFAQLKDYGVCLDVWDQQCRFNSYEISKMKSNTPLEQYDITLLCKISEVLWQMNVCNPGKGLKSLMRKIREERNNVSHEKGSISEIELKKKLDDFGKILKEALNRAYSLYYHLGANFDSLKNEIQENIDKIPEMIREKYDLSNSEDRKRFLDEMEDSLDNFYEYIQEKINKESTPLYKKMCKIALYDWLCQYGITVPSSVMRPLQIKIDEKFHQNCKNHALGAFEQKDMLTFKGPLQEDPEVVILTGDAGSGKTTVLCSVLEKWCEGTGDMPNLDSFPILLHMNFRSHDHSSIDEYLKNRLQRTSCDFGVDCVKRSIVHSKCLIICDGFDERNEKSIKLFESFLGLHCKGKKMIVTTRPTNTAELTDLINKNSQSRINLNVLGIATGKMESHIHMIVSYLISDPTQRNKVVKEVVEFIKKTDDEVITILRTPLLLNLFVLLYIKCPDKRKISSMTMLYKHLADNNRDRIKNKLGIDEDAILKFEQLYKECSLVYYLQEKYEVSEEDAKVFKERCDELHLDFDSVMSSYFNVKHTMKGLDVVKVYSYRHRTAQEYAAAVFISDSLIKCYHSSKGPREELSGSIIYDALISALSFGEEGFNKLVEVKERKKRNVKEIKRQYDERERQKQEILRQWLEKIMMESGISSFENENKSDTESFGEEEFNAVAQGKERKERQSVDTMREIEKKLSFEDENKCNTENENETTDNMAIESILKLTGFITEILYHNEQKDILYLILPDILDKQWEIEKIENYVFSHSSLPVDAMCDYCFRTENDPEIVKIVKRKIQSIYRDDFIAKEIESSNPQSLRMLPELIKEMKLYKVTLLYDNCCSNKHYLTKAVKTATECQVEINLSLDSKLCADVVMEAAKTCVSFGGRLSRTGISSVTKDIKILDLCLDIDALSVLSNRLHEFSELKMLKLHLSLDGTEDITQLRSMEFPNSSYNFLLDLITNYHWTETNIQLAAGLVNAIWPKRDTEPMFPRTLLISSHPSKPAMRGSDVRRLGELLTIQPVKPQAASSGLQTEESPEDSSDQLSTSRFKEPLNKLNTESCVENFINIWSFNEDDAADKQELKEFYKNKGIGELKFGLEYV